MGGGHLGLDGDDVVQHGPLELREGEGEGELKFSTASRVRIFSWSSIVRSN